MDDLVLHQIKYLGLYENVRVRRAGFAYRQLYDKFFYRYRVCSEKTWPNYPTKDYKSGCEAIISSLQVENAKNEISYGKTKIFIRHPEVIFTLEEHRERKVWIYAIKIQKFFTKHVGRYRYFHELQILGYELMKGQKDRRRESFERTYYSDYIGFNGKKVLEDIIERYGEDRALFTDNIWVYNFKGGRSRRVLILTESAIYILGLVQRKPEKGQPLSPRVENPFFWVISRRINVDVIAGFTSSQLADNVVVLQILGQHDILLEMRRKTEFLVTYRKYIKNDPVTFTNNGITVTLKVDKAKSIKKQLTFTSTDSGTSAVLDPKTWTFTVPRGLPSSSEPHFKEQKSKRK